MSCRTSVLALSLLCAVAAGAAEPPRLVAQPADLGIPYSRYQTTDAFGREITFYVHSAPAGTPADAKLPVVLWIEGSGCQSLFSKAGERVAAGYQELLQRAAEGKVRVVAVEKPGVKFLDSPPRPGSAQGASEEFLREHALPRWAEANVAALRAAWMLPDIDSSRTLVVGHSEGGIVAARVAAELPQVTHVASLSGDGPTQLFSLAELDARPRAGDKPGDAEARRDAVYAEWKKIEADPDSITKFWRGHPYRRWSSFLHSSTLSELLRSKARIYVAQGTDDAATSVEAFDVLRAELAAHHRDVTAERIEGADHGFRTADMPAGSPEGMRALFRRVIAWFLM